MGVGQGLGPLTERAAGAGLRRLGSARFHPSAVVVVVRGVVGESFHGGLVFARGLAAVLAAIRLPGSLTVQRRGAIRS